MQIIISTIAFLIAIAILIPFHEFGHFWVARRCGVKVLRFAVGFGKVLWSYRTKEGVEYCLCAIPLGGYVKMLDEREGDVPEAEVHQAFNRQSVWKRFLIVLAGPMFNLLLAILLLFAVFRLGFESPIPTLGKVPVESVAYASGLREHDELLSIDNHPTPTVDNVHQVWMYYVGDPSVQLHIKRDDTEETILFKQPKAAPDANPDFLKSWGVTFAWPPLLGDITLDSPAYAAGLQEGDKVLRIDDQPVETWVDLISIVSDHPHQPLVFDILRDRKEMQVTVTPEERTDRTGMIGAHFPSELMRMGQLGWQTSIKEALRQTYKITLLNISLLAEMATGAASFDNIGGPVTIAYAAGMSAEQGVSTYLNFLAVISIGLAVLNLLPIPMLDGGHLLFYTIEIVLRRPLSERAQEIGLRIGIVILILLMLIALYNDMMRWV